MPPRVVERHQVPAVAPVIDEDFALQVERVHHLKRRADQHLGHVVGVDVHAGRQRPAEAGVSPRKRVVQGVDDRAVPTAHGVRHALALVGVHIVVGRADEEVRRTVLVEVAGTDDAPTEGRALFGLRIVEHEQLPAVTPAEDVRTALDAEVADRGVRRADRDVLGSVQIDVARGMHEPAERRTRGVLRRRQRMDQAAVVATVHERAALARLIVRADDQLGHPVARQITEPGDRPAEAGSRLRLRRRQRGQVRAALAAHHVRATALLLAERADQQIRGAVPVHVSGRGHGAGERGLFLRKRVIDHVQQLGRPSVEHERAALMIQVFAGLGRPRHAQLGAGHALAGIRQVVGSDQIVGNAVARQVVQHGQRGREAGKADSQRAVQHLDGRPGPCRRSCKQQRPEGDAEPEHARGAARSRRGAEKFADTEHRHDGTLSEWSRLRVVGIDLGAVPRTLPRNKGRPSGVRSERIRLPPLRPSPQRRRLGKGQVGSD